MAGRRKRTEHRKRKLQDPGMRLALSLVGAERSKTRVGASVRSMGA
jgi:hypothetical protein